jgi:hypothetical protein
MSDMTLTTEARSDQLNFDSFPAGVSRTIKITQVDVKPGVDQPVDVHFEGMNGRVYRPSKGMRRVMVHIWGKDSATYVGHSLTLYGDADVMFGAVKAGGIRISHMTGIQKPVTMALTATRANRKPFTVKPLAITAEPELDQEKLLNDSDVAANLGMEAYKAFFAELGKSERAFLLPRHEDLKKRAMEADQQHAEEPVTGADDDGVFPGDRP